MPKVPHSRRRIAYLNLYLPEPHLAPTAGTILGGLGSTVWVGRSFWRRPSLDDAATALIDYKLSKNVVGKHPLLTPRYTLFKS